MNLVRTAIYKYLRGISVLAITMIAFSANAESKKSLIWSGKTNVKYCGDGLLEVKIFLHESDEDPAHDGFRRTEFSCAGHWVESFTDNHIAIGVNFVHAYRDCRGRPDLNNVNCEQNLYVVQTMVTGTSYRAILYFVDQKKIQFLGEIGSKCYPSVSVSEGDHIFVESCHVEDYRTNPWTIGRKIFSVNSHEIKEADQFIEKQK